jgi:Mn2+/Fe2+ NRAMP family transporter
VALVLVANIVNLGADISAMGAAAQLLLPAGNWIYVLFFGVASLALQILVPYSRYVKYLKWLTLSLFAYVATAFFVQIPWSQVLRETVHPRFSTSKTYLTGLVAVLGTTISPYLFFWQASQEVEEVKNNKGEKALKHAPQQARVQLGRIRKDTYLGMALSNTVAFFIILTTAATLHAHGQTDIATAAQAAQALAPLAGRWAEALFVCGIIGTGMLAIPVLAGSAAYAMSECFHWSAGLEKRPHQAVGFYMTIAVATLAGVGISLLRIDPIRALFWAAVVNGVLAAPLMAVIMHMASSKNVMDKFTVPLSLRVLGWAATAVMFGVSLAVFLPSK